MLQLREQNAIHQTQCPLLTPCISHWHHEVIQTIHPISPTMNGPWQGDNSFSPMVVDFTIHIKSQKCGLPFRIAYLHGRYGRCKSPISGNFSQIAHLQRDQSNARNHSKTIQRDKLCKHFTCSKRDPYQSLHHCMDDIHNPKTLTSVIPNKPKFTIHSRSK